MKNKYDTIIWSANPDENETGGGEVFLLKNLGYGYHPISDDKIDHFLELCRKGKLWFALYVGNKRGIRWFGKVRAILPQKFGKIRTKETEKENTYSIQLEYI